MINVPNINQTVAANKVEAQQQVSKQLPLANDNTPRKAEYTATIYPDETVSVYGKSNPKLTHTSWFYVNDVHGKMTNMERIYNMTKEFDATPAAKIAPAFWNKNTGDVSKFKVASGDIILGANYIHNQVANKFLDWSGFIASALGNHELDVVEPGNLAKLLSDSKYKMLAANVEIKEGSPLVGKIQKSMVVEKDGEKYGLIGIAPEDMLERVKMNNTLKDFSVKNDGETIKIVQDEVNKLQAQGINKIIVLSHEGTKKDQRLAQETSGIDLIFGAHTHDLIEGLQEGVNLFTSKSGEPVILTQAGNDGENVGILNVDFDENGVG